MIGQDEFLEHIDKCLHKNKRLKHHSNEHNAPLCMRYYICKDCGEILNIKDFSIVKSPCNQMEITG